VKFMHDFGRLVYLEMHKSGSAYVNKFLKECCTLTEIKHKKHGAVKYKYDPKNFYFITIRHPLALYSSLYRYGLDRRGGLYNRLKNIGKTACYENFESFVLFVLDPNNADVLGRGYNKYIADQIGFMSFTFMKLSLRFPGFQIKSSLVTGKKLIELERRFITDLEIKNEDLNQELEILATKRFPQYFDRNSVKRFLENTGKVNASATKADKLKPLSEATYSKFLAQEALLLSRY